MGDKKYTADELKAGPEAPLSGACLDLVTQSFERNKAPRADIVAFGGLVAEGRVSVQALDNLRSDAISVHADPKVPKACKVQLNNALR